MNRERAGDLIAYGLSMGLHAALFGYLLYATDTPDLGFDFTLPDNVEFGLTEAVTVSAAPTQAANPPPTGAAGEHEGEGDARDGGLPVDGGVADAGSARARHPADAGVPSDAGGPGGDGTGDEAGEGRGVAFLPAGSQISLRIDVERIRASPLADDVGGFLAVLPDWTALIEGSEIDPLHDLDRLLVATPNLQRSRLIVAGRASGDEAMIRQAAERLASSAGQTLTWREQEGVPVARWFNRDETERVIAIIGPRHFVICRPVDLPRVLAVARNRGADENLHPADALLSMGEGEGLSLEVEGFRNFAQERPGRRSPLDRLPTRARMAMREVAPDQRIAAHADATFDDAEQAAGAVTYWGGILEQLGRNPIVGVLGVGGLVQRIELSSEEDALRGDLDMSAAEMRQVISLSRMMFMDRARMQDQGLPVPPRMLQPPTPEPAPTQNAPP